MNLYGNNDIMHGFKVEKLKWFWDLLLKSLETGNYAVRNDKGRAVARPAVLLGTTAAVAPPVGDAGTTKVN